MAVETNIAVREAAEALIALGCETLQSEGHDVRKFWSAVAAMATDRAGLTKEVDEWEHKQRGWSPMTDAESRRFGQRTIEFGKHSGTRYDDLPLDYLEWLSERQRDGVNIVRYFESRRVQAEINEE